MATLTKTEAGRWKAVIRRQGWPTSSKTWRTKRDAEDWARRTEDEMARGIYQNRAPAERMTLSGAIDRYLSDVTPTKKESTQKAEQAKARKLRAALGQYSLVAIAPDVVAGYRDEQLADGKSRDTVRLQLALLSHIFEIAIKEWRVGIWANPCRAVRTPKPGKARDRRLSHDEAEKLLRAAEGQSNPMLGLMIRLALATAMRVGEIQRLRRRDVDLKRRTALLRDTKNNQSRTVPLSTEAAQVLRVALDSPVRPIDCDLAFFGEPGRDGIRRGFQYGPGWKRATRDAGITDLRFHDLRHEAVSRLVELGLGDQEVAAISGHKSMQMLRRYTHLRAEDLVRRLDALG
ncbi:site-specific integrase [Endozoicomonas sp. G2_2]|uniref:Integrase n=1 Tax=Salinisphaera orenii YIM 95161 TaxID=1051139 RepID=A0A423PQS7_9GAMM|nr:MULTISPECIES: site-specific integrase [Gammaproteobacteria]MBO9469603.1 site-specific integrase [Endozoicomonas sp. G2_2]ROO27964.1 integrase [Salinisphaera halophila YIM 95161]